MKERRSGGERREECCVRITEVDAKTKIKAENRIKENF